MLLTDDTKKTMKKIYTPSSTEEELKTRLDNLDSNTRLVYKKNGNYCRIENSFDCAYCSQHNSCYYWEVDLDNGMNL